MVGYLDPVASSAIEHDEVVVLSIADRYGLR
jgi:hypothetical protein